MSILLYLALNNPAPLIDFSRIPRNASATTLQSYFAQMADEQTFRMALTKFGLSLIYFEHNGDGSALNGSWLVDTNICHWEGVVCGIVEEDESSTLPLHHLSLPPHHLTLPPHPLSLLFSSSFNSATTRSSVATCNRHRIKVQSDPVRMPRGKEITDKPRLSRNCLLKNAKKNDGSGSKNVTRLSARLESEGSRAVIGGRDGNSRNYAARGTKGSGQN